MADASPHPANQERCAGTTTIRDANGWYKCPGCPDCTPANPEPDAGSAGSGGAGGEVWTITVCSACGGLTGDHRHGSEAHNAAGAHRVEVVPASRLSEAEQERDQAQRNVESLQESTGWHLARAEAAEAEQDELKAEIERLRRG